MRKPRAKKNRGTEDEDTTPEKLQQEKMDYVLNLLIPGHFAIDAVHRFAAVEQFFDYFPGDNVVPEEGGWVLIKSSPPTTPTVPPLSVWFATPWPMESDALAVPFRAKILTPKGELGIFPREYSIVPNPNRYFEFIGQGMMLRFFGGDTAGIPEAALFYLRAKGVRKQDAIALLIGHVKQHGVLWIETDRAVALAFIREQDFPAESRLATADR